MVSKEEATFSVNVLETEHSSDIHKALRIYNFSKIRQFAAELWALEILVVMEKRIKFGRSDYPRIP